MSVKTDSPRRYSLRRRLMVGMGAAFCVIIAIISVGLWSYARNAANQPYDLLLTGASLAILERTSGSPAGLTVDIPYSAFEMMEQDEEDRLFYRVFIAGGQVLTGDPDLPLPASYHPSSAPFYFDAFHGGEMVRFVLQGRLLTSYDQSRWVVAQVGNTRRARDSLERELITKSLAVLVLITGVGLLFVWFGINRALRPLAGIERNLRARESTDLTPLEASPPREVENLIESINSFIHRLKASQKNAQNFIADVAHQTRTSLSTLQGQLELAARQGSLEETRHRLAKADAQARRTIRMTNQLLAHAMVIHRADNQPQKTIDLIPLVRTALEETLRDTISRDIDFELIAGDFDGDEALVVGDPVAIREALRNLLDNAVKHGPEHNRIDVSIGQMADDAERGRVRLTVEDAGPGIPVEKRAEAFDRFHSMGKSGQGAGLGLAIVQAVTDSHGATVRLGASKYGGLRVDLEFPKVHADA